MAATRIHHINFVVSDLDVACKRFEELLGLEPFERIEHAPRGSTIARTPVGQSWLVLVCPHDPESAPGRYLAEHGEGFFLLSVGNDSLPEHLERRAGIDDWKVVDIGEAFGATLQLTEDTVS